MQKRKIDVMSANQSSTSDLNFFSIAAQLDLLSVEQADELTRESSAQGIHPAHLVLRKGLLDAVEIDIVETMLNRHDAIADFEILGLLGKGGMGVVYRAKQKSLDRVVALKTILISQLKEPGLAARFEREATTVAKLQHPNIVTAYDFIKYDARMHFVMELVEGVDVDQLIDQQKRLDEATAIGLTRQAAAGLSCAAKLGIVHRDIKPANMLLVAPPAGFELPNGLLMVKIADFGLAMLSNKSQIETRLTADNATLGSPNYMAPEQVTGESVDHRADIYALGASLYHMLSGNPPFQADTLSQVIALKLRGKLKPLSEINSAVSQATSILVQEMMQDDPEKRLADYTLLMNRLDEILPRCQSANAATQAMPLVGRRKLRELEKTNIITSQDTSLAPTQLSTRLPRKLSLKWLLSAAVILALCLAIYFLIPKQTDDIPVRDMVSSGWVKALFNGEKLSALPLDGSWVVGEDDEKGRVISGTSGTIRQPVIRTDTKHPGPLANYRLLFFARLNEARAIELQFGITVKQKQEGKRSALRFTPKQITLASRDSEKSSLSNVIRELDREIDPHKNHVIQLEYQHGTWWVQFDGDHIGTVRSPTEKQLPEFRLKVEGGPAWFSDLTLEELIPKR